MGCKKDGGKEREGAWESLVSRADGVPSPLTTQKKKKKKKEKNMPWLESSVVKTVSKDTRNKSEHSQVFLFSMSLIILFSHTALS